MSRLDCVTLWIAAVFSVPGGSADGQAVRFTPDPAAGRYKVSLRPETPFREDANFSVRVHSSLSEALVTIKPLESLTVGTFDFGEGTDGVVEIFAKDSTGLVVADAVEFTKAPE